MGWHNRPILQAVTSLNSPLPSPPPVRSIKDYGNRLKCLQNVTKNQQLHDDGPESVPPWSCWAGCLDLTLTEALTTRAGLWNVRSLAAGVRVKLKVIRHTAEQYEGWEKEQKTVLAFSPSLLYKPLVRPRGTESPLVNSPPFLGCEKLLPCSQEHSNRTSPNSRFIFV